MIEAVMIWNEPNNKSHWDPELDPEWARFAHMATVACQAIHRENPHLPRVLGGISPIDPHFIRNMAGRGVLDNLDGTRAPSPRLELVADPRMPDKLARDPRRDQAAGLGDGCGSPPSVRGGPVWGLNRTAELSRPHAAHHWYSLYDLPLLGSHDAHREARLLLLPPFPHGAVCEDGTPKLALEFCAPTPDLGLCQRFHLRITVSTRRSPDERLGCATSAPALLGGSLPPQRVAGHRQKAALADFDVTLILLHPGAPRHRSASYEPTTGRRKFAAFCATWCAVIARGRPKPKRACALVFRSS